MAVVMPLLLFMIMGMVAVGMLIFNRGQLQHVAFESSVAGAQSPAECGVVPSRTSQLLGFTPDTVDCSTTGQIITVRLAHNYPTILPLVPGRVEVVGRAVLRTATEETTDDPDAEAE